MAKGRIDYMSVVIRIISWILDHIFQDSTALRDRTYRDRCCHLANVYELMYATQPTLASSSSLTSAEVYAFYRVLSGLCTKVVQKC